MRQTVPPAPVVARLQVLKLPALCNSAVVRAVPPPRLLAWPVVVLFQLLSVKTAVVVLRPASRPPVARVLPPVADTAPLA